MSIILLIIIMVISGKGVPIDDATLVLLGLLFIGDCIVISRGDKE